MQRIEVTEQDFRKPEFVGANPEDYEFRRDGVIVRKDRWQRGIRNIANIVTDGSREFEIDNIVEVVRWLMDQTPDLTPVCGAGMVGCYGGPNCGSSHK